MPSRVEGDFIFMDFKESIKKGTFYGFMPKRLEIPGLPQLGVFPFNVLFLSFGTKDCARVSGNAVYEPDFSTWTRNGDVVTMTYRNAYGGNHWLTISYDQKARRYAGEKFVNGKRIGMAYGSEWDMFFVHLTALGLSGGEQCLFENHPDYLK